MSEILKNIELRSEEIEEILTKVPNGIIRYGNIILFSLILMILMLSWFIKYPDIIKSQAIITTTVPAQKEYAKITAKIDTILVHDKQNVKPNQPLAILENSAHFEDILLLKSIIDTIDIENSNIKFDLKNSQKWKLGEVETSFSIFETNYMQYQLYIELQPFSNEQLANRTSILELNNQLNELKAQQEIQEAELNLKKNKLNRSKVLFEKGVISASDYEKEQLTYIAEERMIKNLNISQSQIHTSISNFKNISRGTAIDKVKEEMTLYKETLQSLQNLKNSIADWERMYLLKSEINGSVSFLGFWAEHQTVNEGDLVFTIIPNENSEYIARLKTPIQNSGKIKVGQKVVITLSNYPDTEFGRLVGNIQSISSMPNENGFYIVNVSLSQDITTTYNKKLEFRQEMSGYAEIITEDLRLIEKIFYQFKDAFSR